MAEERLSIDPLISESMAGKDATASLSDLEDILRDISGPSHWNGQTFNYGHRAGTFMNTDRTRKLFDILTKASTKYSGRGGINNILQNFLSRIDRLGNAYTPTNQMHTGFTFITRPRLNLTGANLHQHSTLTTLYNSNEKSVAFMIRALLDSRLSKGDPLILGGSIPPSETITAEVAEFAAAAAKSPLFDPSNPFFVPLMNGLKGISGFPDFIMESETTDGDFFGGDFTFAKGSNFMNNTTELSLEFKDVQGGIILSCFFYWVMYMSLQARGVVYAYPDDVYERRLNYTVSIYRFITDMSRGQILWWCKATGCYPHSVPIGALFNVEQGTTAVASATNFTIPFTCNDIKVNDVGILFDFNQLVERYQPQINNTSTFVPVDRFSATNNFLALPYIVTRENEGMWLEWRTSVDYLEKDEILTDAGPVYDPSTSINAELAKLSKEREAEINTAIALATNRMSQP